MLDKPPLSYVLSHLFLFSNRLTKVVQAGFELPLQDKQAINLQSLVSSFQAVGIPTLSRKSPGLALFTPCFSVLNRLL